MLASVWLLIGASYAVLLAVAVPMPSWFSWAYWGPSLIAAVLIQVSGLILQIVSMSLICTVADSPAGEAGIVASLRNFVKSRDFRLVATAYGCLIGGAGLLTHATAAWMVGAAITTLVGAHVAFKRLLDSLHAARPESRRPSVTDPASLDYVAGLVFDRRYGDFWHEPSQLWTESTARKYWSMAQQAQVNLLVLSAVGIAANSIIAFPSIASGGLIAGIHGALFLGSVVVGTLAIERYHRLGQLKDQYLERIAELGGDDI